VLRWPLAGVGALYAIAVLVVFVTQGGWVNVEVFGTAVILVVTALSLAPVLSFFTRTRRPSVVGAVLLVMLLGYFALGLLLWFPVGAGVIAAAIAGPPSIMRRESAADHDRLDALD
jgi:hypothetical protein